VSDRTDLGNTGTGLRRGVARLPAEAGDAGIDVDERRKMLAFLGAEIADAGGRGMKGSIDRRGTGAHHAERRDAAAVQETANPEIHRRTTAEEIWNDTGGNDYSCGVAPAAPLPGSAGAEAAQASLDRRGRARGKSGAVGGQHSPHKIQHRRRSTLTFSTGP
jgi:cysteine synthase A